MLFVSPQKLFQFSRYFSFRHDFLFMQEKRLDQKDKVNFKIRDVTAWFINNCNTHIVQYLTKERKPDNEIWSINRIKQEKYFSSKIMRKMRQGDQFQTSFYFLKRFNIWRKQVVSSLVSIYIFRQPSTCHAIKTNCINLQAIDPEICSILIFLKRVWDSFLYHIL